MTEDTRRTDDKKAVSDETLVDLNKASELINISGEYKQKKKTYELINKSISKAIMLGMFESAYEYNSKFTSSLSRSVTQFEHKEKYKDVKKYEEPIGVVGYKSGVYKEPIFSENLRDVIFDHKDAKKLNEYKSYFFRYIPESYRSFPSLKVNLNTLEKTNLEFNECLFILLGFNTVLTPDYKIINSTHPIDKFMLNTEQGEMLKGFFGIDKYKGTKKFIDFALFNNFLKLSKDFEEKITIVEKKKRNKKILKNWLIESPKYTTKVEAYRVIISKLQLVMTESNLGKIIKKLIQ